MPKPESCGKSLLLILIVLFGAVQVYAVQPWQQEVNYRLDVTLVDSLKSVTGTATVQYINHSPDTLNVLYFRMPPAALQGGSSVDRFDFPEDAGRFSRVDPHQWGDLKVGKVVENGGEAHFEQDYSIGLLSLNQPLFPGDTTSLVLPFTTKFPSGRAASRIGYNKGQYKGAYWYPMICPYTPQYGWTVNRYYGTGEAYGEFGDFEIHYTVPSEYIVASTGKLINQDEVLPPKRLQGLRIDNPDPTPIDPGFNNGEPVTWIYKAERVPDVAFAMDPGFLIDRVDFGHFQAWSFALRDNREEWQGVAQLCGWSIQQLEKMYGPYPWPVVAASDSYSAMEYPMLTLMSGPLNGHEYVFIHEVAHNYTPMILHSNSVDNQALDEGFTTFAEHELIQRYIQSDYNRERMYTRGLLSRKYMVQDRLVRGVEPYLDAVLAGEDLPMVRGGDIAHDYPLLRVSSYYKTPVMLNALRYVVGEDAFWAGMRQYYTDNALTHPDELDMIHSFEVGTNRPLGWFFKQFLYSADDIDYGIRNFSVKRDGENWCIRAKITRKHPVRLPLRLGVVDAAGDTTYGEIAFLPTDPKLSGYARWGTWDQLHEPSDSYLLDIRIDGIAKPKELILDPEGLLVDRYPLDNNTCPDLIFRFDEGLRPLTGPSVSSYEVRWGPRIGWNERWGAMPGIRIRGGFFEKINRFDAEAYLPVSQVKLEPQWRFWGALPLPGTSDGIEGTLYTGQMPGDRFVETGLRAKWRTWGRRSRTHQATMQIGGWDRSIPFGVGMRSETIYMHLGYRQQLPKGPYPGSFGGSLTLGDAGKGSSFAVFQAEDKQHLYRWKKWRLGWEGRLVVSTLPASPQFKPTMGAASPYLNLGDPVLGGVLNDPGNLSRGGRLLTTAPAVIVSHADQAADQFAAYSFRFKRGLGSGRVKGIPGRLLDHLHAGFFQSGAAFLEGTVGSSSGSQGAVFELGVEAELEDLYGVDVRVSVAPISLLTTDSLEEPEIGKAGSLDELKKSFNIFASYRVDRLFR